ncbi:acetolactate synthase large subunit [Pseudohaliea rubra]|uniref:Thiamine pyrophosphate-requiring enzyme n=1 Tax=Pseudohaliea rubra DSM 19751 TaxID=1265313 RepID=A0A095VVT8_9GAMM|nr:acetolactate synthase large subunit [Pseudohaliea rubra]KGE05123.1 Thiamine pyrophosphate-requiring enzyme [Pseudohaliea rubra DSM 19751]
MNGAEALLETLVASGVEVCFANPGTSEMQLVSAIGNTGRMRPVLCLFEGVASGAADGYGRMADKPALTLLHVGSGFANSLANQHNARRAGSPLVNIVGDHASYHLQYDAPLTSDLPALAAWASAWTKVAESPDDLAAAGAAAVAEAQAENGRIATVVVPADHAWNAASGAAAVQPPPVPPAVADTLIAQTASRLQSGRPTVLFLGGRALREENLYRLGQIAAATGARLVCQVFPARLQRGAGRVAVERLPYFAEQATEALAGTEHLILVGAPAPVSFFAYPDKASWLAPADCEVSTLATAGDDIDSALEALVAAVGASGEPSLVTAAEAPAPEDGPLDGLLVGQLLAQHMPEDAIVVDDGATNGLGAYLLTERASRHDWLALTGGAIGQGIPAALGAAIACPDRKVINLEADGSAMYTIQGLWSLAREKADTVTILFNNRSYAILNIELERVGAGEPNASTLSMLDLSNPDLDFTSLARGMGVNASRAATVAEFATQLTQALATPGPHLIEAMV